jgi:hypothetical protein
MSSKDEDAGWKFAQCFGDKGEVEDVTDGMQSSGSCRSIHVNLFICLSVYGCFICAALALTPLKICAPFSFLFGFSRHYLCR